MFGFKRGGLPDLPPPAFRDLPPPPGVKIEYFDSQPSLQTWAVANHIAQGSGYGSFRFQGGYAPVIKTVGLLRPGLMRDPVFDETVYKHEVGGHANGLFHRPGTDADWGYVDTTGKFWPVQTLADLQAAKSHDVVDLSWLIPPSSGTGAVSPTPPDPFNLPPKGR